MSHRKISTNKRLFRKRLNSLKTRLQTEVNTCVLNENLTFTTYAGALTSDGQNPHKHRSLTILFCWMFAKDRHIDKYRKLYLNKGFDVLTVKTKVLDSLLPTVGAQVVAYYVVDFLRVLGDRYDSYVFQMFSIGAYQMGEVLVHLDRPENQDVLLQTRQSLKGYVMDSVMDVPTAHIGLARASTTNLLLQTLISNSMNLYMHLFSNSVTKHYTNSSNSIHRNDLQCPGLFLFSSDDVVADPNGQYLVMNKWQSNGVPVFHKCWQSSAHVSHYFKYADQYEQHLNDFLKYCKLY
ncbi:uncharacterized protein LOC128953846 [Oppia nitens]|uniref:uncharacterized protein LOC128953846 n=1 Tax=Oppia nitens TaxID=1686743 RepID=UPI0023DC8931|nr:uncharacterized protein LOC128953846 [Oppia nitens]